MLDDFGRALQRAHLAHAGDIFAVPINAELEILVRIKRSALTVNWAMVAPPS
jgi:hypothetical protein